MLSTAAEYFAQQQATLVDNKRSTGTDIHYANPIPAFDNKGACGDPELINAIVLAPQSEGDFNHGVSCAEILEITLSCISRESFHPKKSGQAVYAQVMNEWLAANPQ